MAINLFSNIYQSFKKALQESDYDDTSFDVRTFESYPLDRDAFGRKRVSQPNSMFENKFLYDKKPILFTETTSGGSSTITHVSDESSMLVTCGTGTTDKSILQSRQYIPYIPGKSTHVTMTGVFGAQPSANNKKRLGFFDDYNGVFFEYDSTGFYTVVRTDTSGSPVDTRVSQSSFNKDQLNGAGPSGAILDLSKVQIFWIQFQWLGSGVVDFGVNINGVDYKINTFYHSNVIDKVYMRTPSLPVRYECSNTASTTSTNSLKAVCQSVTSDGGLYNQSLQFSCNGPSSFSLTTTESNMIAVRLKSSYKSKENRKSAKMMDYAVLNTGNQNAIVKLYKIVDPTISSGSWTSVHSESCAEYSTNLVFTSSYQMQIDSVYVGGSAGGGRGTTHDKNINLIDSNSLISQNYSSNNSEIFLLTGASLSGTTTAYAHMTWQEFN